MPHAANPGQPELFNKMQSEQTNLYKAAVIVSVIGHPFILLPLTVLVAALQDMPAARAIPIAAITFLVTSLPILLIIRRKVVTGKWANHDVSVSTERGKLYPIA